MSTSYYMTSTTMTIINNKSNNNSSNNRLNNVQPKEFLTKIQPRSSAERDNSILLHSALKAASTDMSHRLLDYASFDKIDCEASCILIALANHESIKRQQINNNNDEEPMKKMTIISNNSSSSKEKKEDKVRFIEQPKREAKVHTSANTITASITAASTTAAATNNSNSSKKDPIMLLMAAAKVVDKQHQQYQHQHPQQQEQRKRKHYDSNRDQHKSEDFKRTCTDINRTWGSQKDNDEFSRQYYSMKQNPKIKKNALHAYITYMIYNDLAQKKQSQTNQAVVNQQSPVMIQQRQTGSVLSRPLTAFLWDSDNNHSPPTERMTLPPLSSLSRLSPANLSSFERLAPV